MSPATFQEISRVARLAVLQSLMTSIVHDELDGSPKLTEVRLSAHVTDEALSMSLTYVGPNGVPLGEVGL